MESNFLERNNVKAAVPANITSGSTGARVSMKDATRLTIVVFLATATSATANTVVLKQHNASSGGTTKALAVTNNYYTKIDAETAFTKTEVTTAEDTYDMHSAVGDTAAVLVFEVLAEDFDRDNNFNHFSVDLGSAGVARYASVAMILDSAYKPAYSQDL